MIVFLELTERNGRLHMHSSAWLFGHGVAWQSDIDRHAIHLHF